MHTNSATDDHSKEMSPLKGAFILNLLFTMVEIAGGLWTNSIAIMADALHDFGDSLSLGIAWYFQKISRKGRDTRYSYGYKRFSLLGAIVTSVVLLVGSVFVLTEAIPRILAPASTHTKGMLLLAVGGIAINGFAALRLRKGKSLNEKFVSLHLLEDVLGWAAILVGSIVMHFTGWFVIDAILSIGISIFVLINIYRNLRSTIRVLLQGVPRNVNLNEVVQAFTTTKGVKGYHDLHLWSLDGDRNILTVHLVVHDDLDGESIWNIKKMIHRKMEELHIDHCTIEVETETQDCQFIEC